jgi:hypothetical protein
MFILADIWLQKKLSGNALDLRIVMNRIALRCSTKTLDIVGAIWFTGTFFFSRVL